MIDELILWLDAPKLVGLIFATLTLIWLITISIIHRKDFKRAVLGEDGIPQFLEVIMLVWLSLFVPMIICDFAFGMVASERAWWSMDSILLITTGGRAVDILSRKKGPITTEEHNSMITIDQRKTGSDETPE